MCHVSNAASLMFHGRHLPLSFTGRENDSHLKEEFCFPFSCGCPKGNSQVVCSGPAAVVTLCYYAPFLLSQPCILLLISDF